jgi:hypothetical protein
MALFPLFRAILARWLKSDNPSKPRRPRRLGLQSLEGRDVPATGGGFTAGGLLGQYYPTPDLSGTPAFVRTDVRINFDWQGRAPGGSTSPEFQAVGANNFSVRWTGQIVPKFSETYTFHTTSDDGIRVWVRPTGSGDWTPVIDHWAPHAPGEDFGSYTFQAGRPYDIRVEYYQLGGGGTAILKWSSPSTPEEVIDPALNLGVNAVTYDYQVYADAAKIGRAEWGNVTDYFNQPNVPLDGNGYPLADAGHIFWEGQDPAKTTGTYLLRFTGRADVSSWQQRGQFVVNGVNYGATLPGGVGYDPGSNTTAAQVIVAKADLLGLNFRNTQRSPGGPGNSGIANVQLLRPIAPGSGTTYQPGELFTSDVKAAYARFTTLRYLTANFNGEQTWGDRKLPGGMKTAWGDRHPVWEDEVMLANETGKDLYVTIPVGANDDYVRRLALLLKYGSDGVNPYTGPVANPVYPGLNPNLRVYVEWGNETWNWAFPQATAGAVAARAAVQNNTAEGQVINYDGQAPFGDFRRWTALKTVEASNTFRSVFGDAAMGSQVRMLLEYQYDNVQDTAVQALGFINTFFANGDGYQHVPNPHPVSYYVWGAGGASYFGASNPLGIASDVPLGDAGFESTPTAPGSATPLANGDPWVFVGSVGVYHTSPGVQANGPMFVGGVGTVPAPVEGSQALYVTGTGTAAVNINFPRAGVYALAFQGAAANGNADGLDFYFDDQRVTPSAADLAPNPGPWTPGTGYGRDQNSFTTYGTVPVYVSSPGAHAFRIVGRGATNQTTVIDNVQVESTDAIYSSVIPGGGQAAGQVSQTDYQAQLTAQAQYAQQYGLHVVAYEGGWSLGGDTQSVPIQTFAKYDDGRAADVMGQAIDAFYRAGGEMDVFGTYDQWYLQDTPNAASYPLVRGIDSRLQALPAGSAVAPVAATMTPAAQPAVQPAPAPTPAPTVQGLPPGWSSDAVGNPDITGSAQVAGNQWMVQGAGANIWGSADQFQFADTAAAGDFTLVTRIDSFAAANGWAKAGIMVRDGTGASASFAGVFLTPSNGVVFETRAGTRAVPQSIGVAVPDGPIWVKLVRRANSFAAYFSTDGQRWTRIGTATTVPMPVQARAGLAVTSHDTTQLATATFSNVAVGG